MFLWKVLYTSTCNKSKLSTISSLHQIYNLLFKRLIQTLGDDISIDWLYWYIYRFQTHHNLYRDIDNVHRGHILYLRNQKSTRNWENVKLLKKVFFKICLSLIVFFCCKFIFNLNFDSVTSTSEKIRYNRELRFCAIITHYDEIKQNKSLKWRKVIHGNKVTTRTAEQDRG